MRSFIFCKNESRRLRNFAKAVEAGREPTYEQVQFVVGWCRVALATGKRDQQLKLYMRLLNRVGVNGDNTVF